jgi:hypothetical protein
MGVHLPRLIPSTPRALAGVIKSRRVDMKSWKKVFILSAVFLIMPVIITFPSFGQQEYVLKFNHVLGAKEPYHQGFTDWASITAGNMTPAVGAAMYAGCTILECSIEEYVKESGSFFIATVIAIVLFIFVPEITLWLPNLLFGKG